MRQETFAILFLMRKGRPKKNGLAPIFARITTGGLRQEVYTQCDSNPETWNQHKERAMGTNKLAIQVNERLNDFRVKIIDIRTKLLAEGYAANAAQIKQRYLNPTCNTMMLIAGLADYAKRRQGEVGVRITQRTADKYERLLRYLKQYLAQRGKAEDIPVERMNYEFLDGFNLFLQTAHRCRHNGAVAVMDCLRNFVLYCLRNEWITKNPFRYYKLKEDEVQAKEHLTAHELELLTRKELDHRLARIRDVFVFCCLTGLAFADADHLRREHLSQDDEGRWWIHKPREKTSVMSRIPLLPASLEILRRYERDEACLARGRVLPTPSNQKMNAYMKEIAAVCGIDKVLTTHCAHHNGAINILDCLRNFILYCLRNEWIEKNPFKNYKLKEVAPPPKEHLTKKEIEMLIAKPMPNLRLGNVRDIFVFCCFTGLSYSDMKKLTFDHIKTSFDGDS
ncbi:phage integrase SAM-like domain-containing protein [Alistipes putredinis]